MSDYYYIQNVSRNLAFNPLLYGQGMTMGEHIWAGNSYVYEFLMQLKNEWKGDRFTNLHDHFLDSLYNSNDPYELEEYGIRGDYEAYFQPLLTYQSKGGYNMLDESWYEKLPEMWRDLEEKYVLVNYDKGLYCNIDCGGDSLGQRKTCTIIYLLMWKTCIDDSESNNKRSWMLNRIGLERRNSDNISWMEDISEIFTRKREC